VLLLLDSEWHWLPQRAFASPAQRQRFVETVVERIAQESLRSERYPVPHPVLPDTADYTVVSAKASTHDGQPSIDLTLRRGAIERHLRFLRVSDVELDDDAVQRGKVRVQIHAEPFPELGGAAVHVLDVLEEEAESEEDDFGLPRLSFEAMEVVDLDAAGAPPPRAAAPVPA